MSTPIPSPRGLPFMGNINDLDPANLLLSLEHLADVYGPIYMLRLPGRESVTICTAELLDEICNEKKFYKYVGGGLLQVRNGLGDGLFTAFHGEHNWELAHRILMPAFGPMAIRSMFDEMYDIASQLVSKWARYGPASKIAVTDDFTRLTLDSIALCAMDTRFNSFYREDLHPFVTAMVYFLTESGSRAQRPEFASNYLYQQATRKYNESIELMKSVAIEVVKERRAHPVDKKDLVNAMIKGRDSKTGESLSDENVAYNMITFLVAGHETTSGLLSFLWVNLLKHPVAYKAAQKEVDEVVGNGSVKFEHLSKLPYINACLRETLRLHPTAPAFSVRPKSDNPADYPVYLGKKKYEVSKGQIISALLPRIHRDPLIWGEDAEEFKPERMLDDNFNKLPPNCWKPFGNGVRACIGRPFAWQEAQLTVCLLLQNFNFRADDPGYKMAISQSLTIKPKGFYMYATLRDGIDPIYLEHKIHNGVEAGQASAKDQKFDEIAHAGAAKNAILILFGSNTGTCESLAQTLASVASNRGYEAIVRDLDSATDSVPKDQPVVIITASYEGEPPDNAAHFVEWLQNLRGSELKGAKYAVFGCGHRDWQATFQRIPQLMDRLFEERGARRVAARGFADAANGDIFNDFDKWTDQTFWPEIAEEYGHQDTGLTESRGLEVEINTHQRSSDLRQDVQEAIVKDVKVLTAAGEPEKRHLELQLPTDMTYRAGDYLAVLPLNHGKIVRRVMSRFGVPWDARIKILEGQNTILPTGREMSGFAMLSAYTELSQPATVKNVASVAQSMEDKPTREELLSLKGENFAAEITNKRVSVLDLLERYPDAALPFGDFLAMLPPMRVRQYSISSSPLVDPTHCTLTYAVLDQEAKAGGKRYLGIASNYLSELDKGDRIRVSVRPSHQAFHPPLDIANVPLVMVCSGTGIAPFRGFVQERAKQLDAGRQLAPAMLFIGCRYRERDRLYQDEFEHFQSIGAVDVRYAFSHEPGKSEGCKYVQDRLQKDLDQVQELWEKGARIYVCGSSAVGEGVRDVIMKRYVEEAQKVGKNETKEEVEEWFNGIRNERYASDVFA